jgi:hypothetical protein
MSRTAHLTQRQAFGEDPKPHRQRSRTVLTKAKGWPAPPIPRPKNEGTKHAPTGGYAASRRTHADTKKLGKRRMRRRGWVLP